MKFTKHITTLCDRTINLHWNKYVKLSSYYFQKISHASIFFRFSILNILSDKIHWKILSWDHSDLIWYYLTSFNLFLLVYYPITLRSVPKRLLVSDQHCNMETPEKFIISVREWKEKLSHTFITTVQLVILDF